ncbi:NUDIX domain-containing protein [Rhodobacteraceae bacterium 2CG4]|uniref:NUDIX domain-containing protein n=1 Tax=Halovulum marinum TaxID=2662447 RepID=A0A6L5YZ35_9RHOB|nr:NUDIX hydrolase [Halovulum marinum]MSU89533.1 NUDIX domain-containing protein [Halovulum marinum]
MRRFGTPPRPGIRYTDRPGAYGVIPGPGGLLLTGQTRPRVEIQLPGGGIDPGETPVQALLREAREETGWTIRVRRRLGVYQRFTWMPEYRLWARKICHIYLCAPGLRLGPPHEVGHRALWMPPGRAVRALGSDGDAWHVARHFRLL